LSLIGVLHFQHPVTRFGGAARFAGDNNQRAAKPVFQAVEDVINAGGISIIDKMDSQRWKIGCQGFIHELWPKSRTANPIESTSVNLGARADESCVVYFPDKGFNLIQIVYDLIFQMCRC